MAFDEGTITAARGARNQALFREVNERVEHVNEVFGKTKALGEWVCECADPACTERMKMSLAEYEAIRENGTRFAVAASDEHVFPELERVAERNERFWVVDKLGEAGAVAEDLNPRSPSSA